VVWSGTAVVTQNDTLPFLIFEAGICVTP